MQKFLAIVAITLLGACSTMESKNSIESSSHTTNATNTNSDWSKNSGFDNDDSNEGM